MPFNVDPVKARPAGSPYQLDTAREPVTMMEQVGAAFDMDNVVASLVNRINEGPAPERVPGFDPLDHLQPGEEYYPQYFADDGSLEDMERTRARLDREHEARRLLADGPLNSFFASTLAVGLDPTTYLPIGGAVMKGGTLASKLARAGGVAAAENAVSEAALQATQETRTPEESLTAIMLGGAIGMGLAGAGAAMSRKVQGLDGRTRSADEAYRGAVGEITELTRVQFPEGTVGAASAAPAPIDTKLASSWGASEAARSLRRMGLAAPSVELGGSPNAASRQVVNDLVDTGMFTQGNFRGVASRAPVELRIRSYDAVVATASRRVNEGWRAYRKRVPANQRQFTSLMGFQEAVGKAMRRSDADPIPEVAALAKDMRAAVFDPLAKEAQRLGLLPEDLPVETAQSYFTRVYDVDKIKAKRPVFRQKVEQYLRNTIPADELESGAEYTEIANKIIDAIMGSPGARIPFIRVPKGRGPLKERTFLIPDEDIEDFLVSGVMPVTAKYVRTMAADVEFAKRFGKPDPNEDFREAIMTDAAIRADNAPTEAERTRILNEAEREASLAAHLTNRIRGTLDGPLDPRYRGLTRAGNVLRNLNFTRLLGSVLLSSLPDVGRVVQEEGLIRTMSPVFADMAAGFKGLRMGVKEARMAGTALDDQLATTIRNRLDLGERYTHESYLERGADYVSQQFGRFTLLNHWNTALKGVTSSLVSSRILETVRKLNDGKALTDRETRKLARSGIDWATARRIASQAEHWEDAPGGLVFANTQAWTDPHAVEAFRDALLRDVDNTIITPGAGDAPIWTSTEWGKTVFQFKRFAMASTQRLLISGLQARDVQALSGIMLMVGLGAMATAFRDISSGNHDRIKERSTGQWIVDSVDRSGVLSLYMEADQLMAKASGHSPATLITGGEAPSRFAARNLVGQALGPTFNTAQDLGLTTRSLLSGETFTQSDLHRLRRMIPGQNLFYTDYLFDRLEAGLSEGMGLPERR
ncbi:hypothetical protein [uncultured Rhodospira sp.]|uniref:hypothetical protein n=1 Tax=uncultured Rhodospira sp. TaxID=1936189 RepID=UPI002612A0A0|nr:hypothetical protein [uncultured Rhodospira sp.]